MHVSQADNLNSECGLSFSWNISGRKRMWLRMNTSCLLVCFPQFRWAVPLHMHSKLRLKGCHALSMQNAHGSGVIYHSCGAGIPKSACGKEKRHSNAVTDRKRRLNSSKAITKINGILKLNGDCPCQIEKPENAHILTAGPARKRSDFHVAGFFTFTVWKKDS